MSGRFFLDTNIFVYSFDRNSPAKARRATELIRGAIQSGGGIISYQVVQEFFNVALRRFALPMTTAEAEQYLSTTLRPLLAVNSSPALYTETLRLVSKFHLPWYDALIVGSALLGECETLYSEDFQHNQQFATTRVCNPFQ